MSSISLCMIVKNEEQTIGRCLDSVRDLCDEIIIVDTGSSDGTREILKNYNCKVFDFKWCDDFSAARNFSFSKAKCDYVLWLDADDVIPTKTLNLLKKLKKNMLSDVYMIKYDSAFKGKTPTFSLYRERIIKNCPRAIWQCAVHECIVPFGKIEYLNISINHIKMENVAGKSDRNIKIFRKTSKIRPLSPREQYYYGRELFDHKKYLECKRMLNRFIKSGNGWYVNVIDAYYLISICEQKLGSEQKRLNALFATFAYDIPRANICYQIGTIFFDKKQYSLAIYWYEMATNCKDATKSGAFVEKLCYNYYPYLGLCLCHYNLGNIVLANEYNEKAGKYLESDAVKYNREFFKRKLG